MSNQADEMDDFGDALAYKAHVPLEWLAVEDSSPPILGSANEQCLQSILNLSEYHILEHSEETTAIAMMERKLDITLQMVSELLRATLKMPSIKSVRMGAHEVSWQETSALPELNTLVDLAIYLHDLYPKPLMLRGQVKSVKSQQCVVALEAQSEEVQQLLEKLIFLHHRRSIATSKKS